MRFSHAWFFTIGVPLSCSLAASKVEQLSASDIVVSLGLSVSREKSFEVFWLRASETPNLDGLGPGLSVS